MKKVLILSAVFCLALTSAAFAGDFDKLGNLSSAQLNQLTQIQTIYKKQINTINDSLMNYNNKIAQVKQDKDKTSEQSALLISAYERNIESLKNQKKLLESEMEKKYKTVMTDEQFKQYQAQQLSAQNAFSNFLQK